MTVGKILEMGLINDKTEVWIRRSDFQVLAHGNWYQDNILHYIDREVECFTWQDDDNFYIDLPGYIKGQLEEVKAAMAALGYPTQRVELDAIDDSRSKVIYSGHLVIGVYDFPRHTFVD